MSLAHAVALYRLAGKPALDGARFSGEVPFRAGIELVRRLRGESQRWFDEIIIDGLELDEDDPLPDAGATLGFVLRLPGSSSASFHADVAELIRRTPKVSRGEMPEDFYLILEDYFTGDPAVPEDIRALRTICTLIASLKELAQYHDTKPAHGHLGLVFVQPAGEKPGHPVVVETFIDKELLSEAKDLEPSLVVDLSTLAPATDPHYSERLGVFGVTLSSFVGRRPHNVPEFRYLVQHWSEFVHAYQNDLGTYLSGFAFHKAKREVAEAELEIASQFSKVISEISGKLFSIPLSLAAVAAIPKAENVFQSTIIVLGLLLAAVIVSGVIENQLRQFRRIKHAKGVVLGAIEGKKAEYPNDLKKAIEEMTADLGGNERSLDRLLLWFRLFSWFPVCIALFVHAFLFADWARGLILWL